LLVLAVGGLAIFIAAIAMTVGGLTLPGRYSGATPPPNIGSLGSGQIVGGIALLVLGAVIMASAAALLADLPRSRALATGVSSIAALLSAVAVAVLMGATRKDAMLIAALAVTFVAFGGAAVVLGRLRR
jgi:radical SAM superfamily enzyme with C-terminal helix-hairpin-helix motif